MKDLTSAINKRVNRVSEMSDVELDEVSKVLERGLIHVMVEQYLRASQRVSHLHLVSDAGN